MNKVKLITLLLIMFLNVGCTISMTIVYAPKCQHICGDNNTPLINGSDLKGAQGSQETKSVFETVIDKLGIPLR